MSLQLSENKLKYEIHSKPTTRLLQKLLHETFVKKIGKNNFLLA